MIAAERAFESAAVEEDNHYAGVQFLVVGPKGLKMSLPAARHHGEKALRALLKAARHAHLIAATDFVRSIRRYLRSVNVEEEDGFIFDKWSLICRLLNAPEVRSRYESNEGLEARGTKLDELKNSYFWVVEARHTEASRHGDEDHIAHPDEIPPAVVFVWNTSTDSANGPAGPEPLTVLQYRVEGGSLE
jgi:hypothetical protein